MTHDEIMKLEAGRELDALVAQHVMEWRRVGEPLTFFVPPIGDKREVWAAEWDENGLPDWLPCYSTDIAEAWQVVEKMRSLGFTDSHHGGRWSFAKSDQIWTVKDLCTPLAICRAAMLAVMDNRP